MDHIDSEVVCGLAERVAEGKISVRAAAKFGGDLTKDGCSKACQWFRVCCMQWLQKYDNGQP